MVFSHIVVTQKGPECDMIKTKAREQQNLRNKLSDQHNELYTLVNEQMTASVEVKERFFTLLIDNHEQQVKKCANIGDIATALEKVQAPSTLVQQCFRLPAEKANKIYMTKL